MQSKFCSKIFVGARSSNLSKAQVREVQEAIRPFTNHSLLPVYTDSKGDKDQKTSLRDMGRTDFFTKEIDDMLLRGLSRISVHSAKDLPEEIHSSLYLAAITEGVDSSDSLVFRDGLTFASLPKGAVVATSSLRREEIVRSLREDLRFVDLRGTIERRLEKLQMREADAVVIAEAALIRLQLTHLHRIKLPGETAPLQGRLAILTRKGDDEMIDLFSKIDIRRREKSMLYDFSLSRS